MVAAQSGEIHESLDRRPVAAVSGRDVPDRFRGADRNGVAKQLGISVADVEETNCENTYSRR